LQTNALTC